MKEVTFWTDLRWTLICVHSLSDGRCLHFDPHKNFPYFYTTCIYEYRIYSDEQSHLKSKLRVIWYRGWFSHSVMFLGRFIIGHILQPLPFPHIWLFFTVTISLEKADFANTRDAMFAWANIIRGVRPEGGMAKPIEPNFILILIPKLGFLQNFRSKFWKTIH